MELANGGGARRRDCESAEPASTLCDWFRALFERSPTPKLLCDRRTLRIVEANEAAVACYGYPRCELLSMRLPELDASPDGPGARLAQQRAHGRFPRGPWSQRSKGGATLDVEIHLSTDSGESSDLLLVVAHDVTERAQLIEQLVQAQKMEAIGRLAGGIAHDFNNLLSVILSYVELDIAEAASLPAVREDLEEIRRAAQRAATLTRQLLAFSRKQVHAPRILALNDTIAPLEKMLERVIGEDVVLDVRLDPALGTVRADPDALEQVLMNLVVNARDAMPNGGTIRIETRNVDIDAPSAHVVHGMHAGPYVVVAIQDTGTGMSKETLARIFEPFFTTKPPGKGTGLGLSTVFGVVKQSGGAIRVDTRLGAGTTFYVYLPRVDEEAVSVDAEPNAGDYRGSGRVIVVEDDVQVRAAVARLFTVRGFDVSSASCRRDALALVREHRGDARLLITDIVMGDGDGIGLAEEVLAIAPGLPIIFMSGYTEHAVLERGRVDPGSNFLRKPFSGRELDLTIERVLNQRASSSA